MIYLRVSTGKQAEKDISIPDQRKQLKAYCKNNAYIISGEYKDSSSGRTDRRPGFQAMIDDLLHGDVCCDLIIVHSFSRFFRDQVSGELYIRSLAKKGVRVISLTQHVEDTTEGQFLRRILSIFDEYQSIETSKHVKRSLHENAVQGFWNGGVTPFGYTVIETEKRGKASKKGLAILEPDATLVREIFDLFLKGDGKNGPMGIKSIVSWLNKRGYRTRRGKKWGISGIHRMLHDLAYTGNYIFHSSQNGGSEVEIKIPALISKDEFKRVQQTLADRNPKKTPPRVVTGPVLLTGLAKCPYCDNSMTLRTGKSGTYRYYSCSNRMRTGATSCNGRSVPMADLDHLVIKHFQIELGSVEAVTNMIAPLSEHQSHFAKLAADNLSAREAEVIAAKRVVDNLYSLVREGLVEASEQDFKNRYLEAKADLERSRGQRDRVAAEHEPNIQIDRAKILSFVDLASRAFSADAIPAKKGFLRALIDEIIVGEECIIILGRRSNFENAIKRGAAISSSVPTFVREWRRLRDSNPGRAHTLAGFQDRCIRPLCQASTTTCVIGHCARRVKPLHAFGKSAQLPRSGLSKPPPCRYCA